MSTNPNQRQAPVRKFEINPAVFDGTSLYLGLVGPSGSGKTFSALELARGIQIVTGGTIALLDSENKRGLHYAKHFQFDYQGKPGLLHVPFAPPFPPSAYQTAYETIVRAGVKIIVTDSYTHEHEGVGGVLEMHDAAIESGTKDPSAWGPAKGERRELKEFILQTRGGVHWIFCFRAKEKMRWIKGQPPEPRGLMPLGDESFIFEQTCNFLLPAGANGVPVLGSPYPDEEMIVKVPRQYRHLFTEPRQLSAALGTHLAAWAVPSWNGVLPPLPTPMKRGQSASVGYSAPSVAASKTPAATTTTDAASLESIKKEAIGDVDDEVIGRVLASLEAAETIDEFDIVEPSCKRLIGVLSLINPKNADVLRAAANAALDRIEAATELTEAGKVLKFPEHRLSNGSSSVVASSSGAAATITTPPVTRGLSAIEQLNADGLARFREALASLGETITQEQAGQLVRDHLADYASAPKVGTEDGAQAQDEIMKRTQPPFASRASLGVMRRHLETCDAFPTYKTFCADLLLCNTAENVYECWRINGDIVDALPDQPNKDARLRAVKRVETVDPTITQGGPWLTKRIREGKAKEITAPAPASFSGRVAAASTAPAVAPAVSATPPAPTPSSVTAGAPVATSDRVVHEPIISPVGQTLAIELEKTTTADAAEEMKTRIDRAFLQKKIPTGDAKTLLALQETKRATFTTATT